MVDFYGKLVGEYTIFPWILWVMKIDMQIAETWNLQVYMFVEFFCFFDDAWRGINDCIIVTSFLGKAKTNIYSFIHAILLLMEEIPNNHLGWTKPCKQWDNRITYQLVGRISSINSSSLNFSPGSLSDHQETHSQHPHFTHFMDFHLAPIAPRRRLIHFAQCQNLGQNHFSTVDGRNLAPMDIENLQYHHGNP